MQWGQDQVLPAGESFQGPIESLIDERFIISSVDDCIEEIARHRNLFGANELSFRIHFPGMPQHQVLAVIERLGTRLPRV